MRNRVILAGLSLALGACGNEAAPVDSELAALDAELAGAQAANAADPQIMAALNDPIMVDPLLSARSNGDSLRPPSQPYAAPVPHPAMATGSAAPDEKLLAAPAPTPLNDRGAHEAITLGALARVAGGARAAACAARLTYSAGWAHRLPAGLPLHPDARVIEAAGTDEDGCAMRAVSFRVARPIGNLIDWYYTRAAQGGYSADHQADGATHMLGGTRRGAGSYIAFFTDRGGDGTDVDLITAR